MPRPRFHLRLTEDRLGFCAYVALAFVTLSTGWLADGPSLESMVGGLLSSVLLFLAIGGAIGSLFGRGTFGALTGLGAGVVIIWLSMPDK